MPTFKTPTMPPTVTKASRKRSKASTTVTVAEGPPFKMSRGNESLLLSKCPDIKTKKKLMNAAADANAGVLLRYSAAWYLYQEEPGEKFNDAGGKHRKDERMMETALRECQEEVGISLENITKVHEVFTSRHYSMIVVDADKEPVPQNARSAVKRVEKYSSVVKSDRGRLGAFVYKEIDAKLKKIEDAEMNGGVDVNGADDEPSAENNYGFIFDDDN